MVRKRTQSRLNISLLAADALARTNQLVEAEIRYIDALRTAEKTHGEHSDQAMLVATILAAFYRSHNRVTEAMEFEARLAAWTIQTEEATESENAEHRFVGSGNSSHGNNNQSTKITDGAIKVPANLRKVCRILGLSVESPLTTADVNRAWKKQMLSNSAHPDLGGNTDEAVLLNQAKEELISFLESRVPKLKLGKKDR